MSYSRHIDPVFKTPGITSTKMMWVYKFTSTGPHNDFLEFLKAPSQTTPHVIQIEYVVEGLQSSEHPSTCQMKGTSTKRIC